MRYYIDFDSTLFDTNTFVNDFYSILRKYDLDPKEMFKTNEKLYNGKAVDYLNIIEVYIKNKPFYNQIKKELSNLYNNIINYLYPDTIESLELLRKEKNNKLIIITLGNKNFQHMKVKNAGILKYFDEEIYTPLYKSTLDIDYNDALFIDDNPVELQGLVNNGANCVRIRRPNGRHSKDDMDNIKEYKDMISFVNDKSRQ